MTLFDSHAHLDDRQFSRDLAEVLKRAREWGVGYILVPGASRRSSERAVELVGRKGHPEDLKRTPALSAAVGVHPHDASKLRKEDLDWFREQLVSGRAIAVGEIGLDYYRDLSPRPIQQRAFREQLSLARDVGRPIIVHDRNAGFDVLRILREEHADEVGGVFHCFSEDLGYVHKVLDLGFYIGIDGPVTYESAGDLREVARAVPIERLLLETDSPYLAPQRFRGHRNEPAYVKLVAEKIAELRGMSLEEVAQCTTENALRLFGPREPQPEVELCPGF